MKKVLLDSGPIISLALNNLLWLFEKCEKDYKIQFYLTPAVRKEVIDNPLSTKKFKFEALQVQNLLDNNTFKVLDDEKIIDKTNYLLKLTNEIYFARGRTLNVVHYAEVSAVAASIIYNIPTVMIDERTTRYLFDKPNKLKNIFSHKLRTRVQINKKNLSLLNKEGKTVRFIRSAEFVSIAFERGMLNNYLRDTGNAREELLDALLWGLKLNGCAISRKDLEAIKRIELKNDK